MPKLNVQEVASQVLSRKVDRVDICMLEVLEAADKQTLRLEDRIENVRLPPVPGAPPGTPHRYQNKVMQGLQSLVDNWCASRPDLTVVPQPDLVEVHAKTGEERRYKREPAIGQFTIARLERLTNGSAECPGLIEHVGGADEETSKKPTRLLTLSPTGEAMLALWREGRVPNIPYPDPKPPKVKGEKEQEPAKA